MNVKCEEGHDAYVDCEEPRCFGRGADIALCEKHQKQRLEEARDEGMEKAREIIGEVMEKWEFVTDIDNPVSILDLKKELLSKL